MQAERIALSQKIAVISRICLGLVFIAAFATKAVDIVGFGRRIEIVFGTFGVSGSEFWILFSVVIACLILLIELVTGGFLLAGYKTKLGAYVSIGLLTIFIVRMFWEVSIGQDNDCGCFGAFIERSSVDALMENLVFLVLGLLSLRSTEKTGFKRKLITFVFIIGGISWAVFFHYNVPATAAVRTGSPWNIEISDVSLHEKESKLVWLFDPECSDCQEQFEKIVHLTKEEGLPELIGITSARPGRIQEFRWDFEIDFKIDRISKKIEKKIYLPSGSLILIQEGSVKRIWRPRLIPSSGAEIREVMEL